MHTPLMSVTTLFPFMMPYSYQIKIGSSNEIIPFVSTVAPTALFGNLPSSWPETANHLHPALTHHQDQLLPTMSPTMHPALKFASDTTSESALFPTAGMPTRAGHLAATGHTMANGVQNAPNELSRAQTPLRHTQFERELVGHPDKAWVSRNRTHWPSIFTHACNLSSAFQHPEVIDQELAKEVDASRILGPLTTPPIYPLHCLCLSAIPKKNSKW